MDLTAVSPPIDVFPAFLIAGVALDLALGSDMTFMAQARALEPMTAQVSPVQGCFA